MMAKRSRANRRTDTGWLDHLVNVEDRIHRQQEWLKCHGQPLVTFTVKIPNNIDNNALSHTIFDQGIDALYNACSERGWTVTTRQILYKPTGPEAIFVIDTPSASLLKAAMIKIEHSHKLGQLMDLNVTDTDGHTISRAGCQMPRRKCLVCGRDKDIFDYSHHHGLKEQISKVKEIASSV
jgi:holo-ACP synthase